MERGGLDDDDEAEAEGDDAEERHRAAAAGGDGGGGQHQQAEQHLDATGHLGVVQPGHLDMRPDAVEVDARAGEGHGAQHDVPDTDEQGDELRRAPRRSLDAAVDRPALRHAIRLDH